MNGGEQRLERTLTLRGAVTLNLLDMIGVGPFITLPLLIGAMGGPQAMVGWVLGAVLAACDGMVWAELGAAMPEAGGTYAYLEQMYPGRVGRWLSFLFAFQLLLSAPLSVASGCIGVAAYAGAVVPGLRGHAVWVAVASVVVAVALQYRRLSGVKRVAQGLLVVVLATIAWTVVTGVWHGEWSRVVAVPRGAFQLDAGFFVGLASAMLIATYDYWGYYNVTFLGGEAKDPGRTIPRAVLMSIALVAVLYLAMNASVLAVLGAPGLMRAQSAGATAGDARDVYADGVCAAVGVRRRAGEDGGGAGDGDGVRERVFAAAGVLADTVCGGEGWELSGGVWEAACEGVSVCVAAGAGGCGVRVLLLLAGGCDCGAGGGADPAAVFDAACGGDVAAEEAAGDGAAVSDVAVSAAADCGAGGVWVHRVCEAKVGEGVDAGGGGGAGGDGGVCVAWDEGNPEGQRCERIVKGKSRGAWHGYADSEEG